MRKLYKITIETDDDNFYRLKPDNDSINYGGKRICVDCAKDIYED